MPDPITRTATGLDLSARFFTTSTIVGSPAAATETIVAQISGIPANLAVIVGVWLSGSVAFTVGTSGTAVRIRIRQGLVAGSGTVIADSNALTGGVAATNLLAQDIQNIDTAASGGAAPASPSYHMSLQVTSGAATSTVSQVNLIALVI